MHLARTRSLFFLTFIACALILGATLYLQKEAALTPCMLCIAQRAMIVFSGLVCLAACLHDPGRLGWRVYSICLLLAAATGACLAGSQVWLQTATRDALIPILARFEWLIHELSIHANSDFLLGESLHCAEINWTLVGISIPEWSLLAFVGIAMFALYGLFSALSLARSPESTVRD